MNIIQKNFILFECVWTMLPSYLSGMERCWTLSVTQALNGNQLLYYSSWYLKNKCWELSLCLLFPFFIVHISAWSNCIDEIALEVKFYYFRYFMQITCSCYVLHANFVNIFMDPQDLGYSKLQYSNISIFLEEEFNVWTKSIICMQTLRYWKINLNNC